MLRWRSTVPDLPHSLTLCGTKVIVSAVGIYLGVATTNNALESLNKMIKKLTYLESDPPFSTL
jgi:hypothetical protein